MGLGDRPVVTPDEIRDGRRIETTLLGERMSVALFSVDGRTLGPRAAKGADGQGFRRGGQLGGPR